LGLNYSSNVILGIAEVKRFRQTGTCNRKFEDVHVCLVWDLTMLVCVN